MTDKPVAETAGLWVGPTIGFTPEEAARLAPIFAQLFPEGGLVHEMSEIEGASDIWCIFTAVWPETEKPDAD